MKKKKKYKQQTSQAKKPSVTSKAATPITPMDYFGLFIILLIALIAFLPALKAGFVWDDKNYIQNNPELHSINLKEIFSSYVLGNYHPLTMLSLAIEYHFWGLNEAGYHIINVLLHLLNIILVFYTIFLLSNKTGVALIVALLFGIHPMHVESVAWASELKDLLYTFFFLASYILYLKYIKSNKNKFLFYALLLFMFSLLSKAMAVSLPLLLLLTDYFKGRKINIKILLEKLPFFILAVIFGVVAIHAQKSSHAIQDINTFTFPQRIIFASYSFITYLLKLLVPFHLSAYYPYPIRSGEHLPSQYYIYVLLFLGLIAFVIYSIRFSKKVLFGIGFFTITVFLGLQLLPVGDAIMADRYSYIPSIGIFYLAGEGVYWLRFKSLKGIVGILLTAFTVFFSVQTYLRCRVWENGISLWDNVINQFQTIAAAYNNRGNVYFDQNKLDLASDDFKKSLSLNPDYYPALDNMGALFGLRGQYDSSLKYLNKALTINPDYITAYRNRGLTYLQLNRNHEAIKDFEKMLEYEPGNSDIYNAIGTCYRSLGKYPEALATINKAIEIKQDPHFYLNRSYCYKALQNIGLARKDALTAKQGGLQLEAEYARSLNIQ